MDSVLGTDSLEVYRAALAMADFDGRFGDYGDALEWLEVAETYGALPPEYEAKRGSWRLGREPEPTLIAALATRTRHLVGV